MVWWEEGLGSVQRDLWIENLSKAYGIHNIHTDSSLDLKPRRMGPIYTQCPQFNLKELQTWQINLAQDVSILNQYWTSYWIDCF